MPNAFMVEGRNGRGGGAKLEIKWGVETRTVPSHLDRQAKVAVFKKSTPSINNLNKL
jgi:hypothetical protein